MELLLAQRHDQAEHPQPVMVIISPPAACFGAGYTLWVKLKGFCSTHNSWSPGSRCTFTANKKPSQAYPAKVFSSLRITIRGAQDRQSGINTLLSSSR